MRTLVLSFFALALVVAPTRAQDNDYNAKIDIGQKAPAFSGIPATTSNGQEASLSLSDIKDDVVVLVFLANHCPVVTEYEDRIIDFANEFKDKGVRVVGVCVTGGSQRQVDDLNAIKQRVKDKGYNFVYGFDESQKIGRDYDAKVTPQFFVLDKDRTVRYMGAMDDNQNESRVTKNYLKDAVNAVLAGREVEVKATRATGCGIQYDRR